jgi:hypothetical protein
MYATVVWPREPQALAALGRTTSSGRIDLIEAILIEVEVLGAVKLE